MSVAASSLDIWFTPELFVGGPRPTPYGPMDGAWFGHMLASGDVSGGSISLTGLLSPRVKRDWVMLLETVSFHSTRASGADAGTVLFATGPFKTVGLVNEPAQFKWCGNLGIGGASDSGMPTSEGGMPFKGLPLYTGNPSASLNYSVFTMTNEDNGDGETYRCALWGWLIRRSEYFHGVVRG